MRVVHANAAEAISTDAADFHLASPVIPYADFMRQHQTFLVIGEVDHVSDWFLRSVLKRGASASYLGHFDFAGKHLPLWLVQTKPGYAEASSQRPRSTPSP